MPARSASCRSRTRDDLVYLEWRWQPSRLSGRRSAARNKQRLTISPGAPAASFVRSPLGPVESYLLAPFPPEQPRLLEMARPCLFPMFTAGGNDRTGAIFAVSR